jgi:hypothetical protein
LKDNFQPLRTRQDSSGLFVSLPRIIPGIQKRDYFVNEIHDGFLIVLHDPFDLPTPLDYHFYTHTFKRMKIYITPETITADESLNDLTPEEFV